MFALGIGGVLSGAQRASATNTPGICQNDKTKACATSADCGGSTCYLPSAGGQTMGTQACMQTAAGFGLTCTANDVSIAQTTSLVVVDKNSSIPGVQGCLFPGDTATISFVAQYVLNATNRYDIGVWVAQDGGDALTGMCSVSDFPISPSPPWTNLDAGKSCSLRNTASCTTDAGCQGACKNNGTCSNDSSKRCGSAADCNFGTCSIIDTCGDITSSNSPLYSSIQNIAVECIDTNGDGNLDISVCLSWKQSGDNGLCTSPMQSVPGSPSKCSCQTLPGIAIAVPGVIRVDKITHPSGDPTSFNFTLTGGPNSISRSFSLRDIDPLFDSGPVPLGTYAVAESVPGGWSLTSATCVSDQAGRTPTPNNIVLHNGETVTCTFNDQKVCPTCPPSSACASYTCDASTNFECVQTFAPATTVCRPSASICDVAETCTGSGAACPADAFQPSSTVCRAAAGVCDVAESCTGTSTACPADAKSTAQCRASAGFCDVAESCDGTNNACPTDVFQSSTTQCRAAAGICDVAESCTGTSAVCPADAFQSSSSVCRTSAGVCDPAESCTGTSATCPADAKSTTQCRAAAGVCDVAESCDGTNNDCPVDAFQASSSVCRAAAGVCDVAESCTGTSATCPADAKSTAQCRASAGVCDLAESCDGTNNDCPVDAFQASSSVCRAAAGVCDVAESCTGSSATCPADAKSTAQCRASAGFCDVAESCDGTNNDCPADAFQPSGVVCRSAAGVCDVAESCTGTSAACPVDAFQSPSSVCRRSAGICDPAESCTGTSATCPADAKSTIQCRAAAGVCDVAESCDGTNDDCPVDAFQPSSVCRAAAGVCDMAESCTGTSAACPADAFQSSSTVCRTSAGVCDPTESCTGTSATCPADAKSTTQCRAAAGVCDVAESCDGTSNDCPVDAFQVPSTVCRAAAGVCDAAESCTGTSAGCPADAKSTAQCRAAAGVCDVAESCDGTSDDCPPDAFTPATTPCRAAAGVCDVAESCTGSSASCPADGKSTAECRTAADVCDVAESCDGTSNDCPPDAFTPATTPCRAAAGVCDVAESCTGSSASCPADAKSTAICRAAVSECDVTETCDGTSNSCPPEAFTPATTPCRAAAGVCDVAESCTGSSASCPADAKSTAICRAAVSECDVTETCDGTSNSCPPDTVQPDGTDCQDTDGMSCTLPGCQHGQCAQRHQVTCPCDVDVTKMGCVVPSTGADCQGQVVRMVLQYTAKNCAATRDSQAVGKVTCTDGAPLGGAVRILVTAASDASKVYADVSPVNVGGTITATAANAGATAVAPSTRVRVFGAASGVLLQEIVYDTSCTQPLNLGDQFGSVLLVGLKTTGGGDISYDPSQCIAALPVPPPPPNCLGKIAVLRLRYDGGGCSAMSNTQTSGSVTCTQSVSAPSPSPARVRVTDGGTTAWRDTGAPASVELGDIVDVIAQSVSGKTTLGSTTVVSILDASGVLIEQVKFKSDCSQPVNLGDEFGGFTAFGMRTTNGGAASIGSEVNYTYTISNTGTADASDVTVQDDRIGPVPGSPIPSLASGASATLSASQLVETTTINTVTVTGNGGMCSAEAKAAVVAPCTLGYPSVSSEPRTSVVFNESEVLRTFQPPIAGPGDRLTVFYNDEHALTLGVRRVVVKTASGTATTDHPVSPLTTNPGGVSNPSVGTMMLDGDQAGTDGATCTGFPDRCDRPMFPALFITDVTSDPTSRIGDWQFGGTPIAPHAVYGTWKAAVKTVDKTKNPPAVTVTPDADPAKNNWNLGSGDPAPAGLTNEGYGAEVVWNVDALGLIEGHVYRVQVMVHDGDQNKTGGDSGQSCATVFIR